MKVWEQVEAIEDEFGEPIADILRGFREQGHSWATIAGSLDMPLTRLTGILNKLHLWDGETKYTPEPRWDIRARELGYEDFDSLVASMRLEGRLIDEIAAMVGCHEKTVRRRIPPDLKHIHPVTDKVLTARRENARRTNELLAINGNRHNPGKDIR